MHKKSVQLKACRALRCHCVRSITEYQSFLKGSADSLYNVGNTLIIFAVFTTRRLRTVTNYFVTSLAVADWLVGTFVMPIAVVYHVTGEWTFGRLICDIWVSLDVCLCTASILSLCAISIDRYFAITKPLRYSKKRRSKRLASLMILVVWLVSLVITCAPLFGWYDKNRHNNKSCTYNQNKVYVVFSAMGSFFLPLVVVVYVYLKISCVIAERHNKLEALNGQKLKCSRNSVGHKTIGISIFKYTNYLTDSNNLPFAQPNTINTIEVVYRYLRVYYSYTDRNIISLNLFQHELPLSYCQPIANNTINLSDLSGFYPISCQTPSHPDKRGIFAFRRFKRHGNKRARDTLGSRYDNNKNNIMSNLTVDSNKTYGNVFSIEATTTFYRAARVMCYYEKKN
ncbi:hypothetical protein QTP88_006021 [Uroleucon formosanum]